VIASSRARAGFVLFAAVILPSVWACQEKLNGGAACPSLCPGANAVVRDTVFDGAAVLSMDTTLTGYAPYSGTFEFLVAAGANTSSQDSLDIRSIVRFDSITYNWDTAGVTKPATFVESAFVRVYFDTLNIKSPGGVPITVEAYDVDSAGIDTTTTVLASLFRPDRFLGSTTVKPGARTPGATGVPGLLTPQIDSITVFLDSTRILQHVTGDHVVRVGFRITSPGPAWIGIYKVQTLNVAGASVQPKFSFMPTTDTVFAPLTTAPNSTSPAGDTVLTAQLAEYSVSVVGTPPPPGGFLSVGGMPASRTYLKFNLPSNIVDSTSIVRATLTLTHLPSPLYALDDTMIVYPEGILSTAVVSTPAKNALFLAPTTLIGIDSVRVPTAIADTVNMEFVSAIRTWYRRGADTVQRIIVLQANYEGATPYAASFYSAGPSVPPSLRPHLHLAYVSPLHYPVP
jgi:hypothetical protein